MKKYLFPSLCLGMVLGLFPATAHAATMSNDGYTIEQQTVDIQPYSTDAPQKPKKEGNKPVAQGEHYLVETTNPDPLSISFSTNALDFGQLTATNPVIRELSVIVKGADTYQLLTAEDHPLKFNPEATIPDTTCDNGSCSELTAAEWSNTLTYGFGYHTEHMDQDNYKQFADISRNESFQPAPTGKLTLRVNISGTQTKGDYANNITFIVTPNF